MISPMAHKRKASLCDGQALLFILILIHNIVQIKKKIRNVPMGHRCPHFLLKRQEHKYISANLTSQTYRVAISVMILSYIISGRVDTRQVN